jgi:hypothetical protein
MSNLLTAGEVDFTGLSFHHGIQRLWQEKCRAGVLSASGSSNVQVPRFPFFAVVKVPKVQRAVVCCYAQIVLISTDSGG